ncbi:MAG: redoxin domain-containing protein, partial [Thermoguttaceae bacterium]
LLQPSRRSGLLMMLSAAVAIAVAGCGPSEDVADRKDDKKQQPSGEETPAKEDASQRPTSADEVLQAMAAAYLKTPTYADKARIRLFAVSGDQQIDKTFDTVVALERPNKLRLDLSQVVVVSDGERLHAALSALPDQVVDRPAPAEITLQSIFVDPILEGAIAGGVGQTLPQLGLLLSKTALDDLTRDTKEPTLEDPGEIEGRPCYRVKMLRPDGYAVFWIDQESFTLRRLVFPTNELRRRLPLAGQIDSVSLVADFHGAELGGTMDENAFRFEAPEGAEVVRFFIRPSPAQLLGKKVPDFKVFALDGTPITPESLAGKIAVMDFWATWCGPCREGMPHYQQVYQKYKDNDKVRFLAVSVDSPQTNNETLLKTLSQWEVSVPLARDMESNAGSALRFEGIPTMIVIDGEGIVQDAHTGLDPGLAANLPMKLDKLLDGENIYQEALDEYLRQREFYEQQLEAAAKAADSGEEPTVEEHALPKAEIAPQSAPQNFKLIPAWTCKEVRTPGNILAAPGTDGKMRLLVIDDWKSVAELGLDGKLIANHPLGIEQSEVVTTLRTAVGADGKRYFAAMASAQQRFHLFDQKWELLLSYPEDALKNKHAGIADLQLGDLDGDGVLKAYLGYWGVVGVQAVSLQGKRLWSDRSVANVVRVAIGGPNQQNQRNLYCIDDGGLLVIVNPSGESAGTVSVAGHTLQWVVAADLDADAQPEWCGLSASQLGDNNAVGFNLSGDVLWSKQLPPGMPPTLVEPIIAGNITSADAGQWILIGPDGSVHIVSAAGESIDQFNFGAAINGLATAESDGRPLLIISSAAGVQAWFVER